MKILIKSFLILTILSVATACSARPVADDKGEPTGDANPTNGNLQVIVETLEVEVVEQNGKYKLVIKGGNCGQGAHGGCVDLPKNKSGLLVFNLTNVPAGQEWAFTRARVCETPPPANLAEPPSESVINNCKLNKRKRLQFAATAERTPSLEIPQRNGIIDLDEIRGSEKSFQLYSANNAVQFYAYQLEACLVKEDAPDPENAEQRVCANSDPRIRNRGRGGIT